MLVPRLNLWKVPDLSGHGEAHEAQRGLGSRSGAAQGGIEGEDARSHREHPGGAGGSPGGLGCPESHGKTCQNVWKVR